MDVFEDMLYVIGSPKGLVWQMHKFGRLGERTVGGLAVSTPIARLRIVHPAKRCSF